MVPDEEDKVERFIGGLSDNIQGNVIVVNSARLQDAIRIANQLMKKKLQGYATRSTENKRRMESNPRDNRGHKPSFKRQNTTGQNVARAYTAGNNERKRYVGFFPYCNKCRLYHERLYTIRCRNCKKIVHQTRDCRVTITPNTQGATVENQQGIVCYECGRPRHFRKDCPKLRNQHRGNQTRNKTGGNEVIAKAYAIGGGGTNLDSNVVTARLQDAIRIANQLMKKKLQGYATRSTENKRRMESNPRDNRRHKPSFKRQNTTGQNVARAYTAGNNERKRYVGFFPYCNKCRLYHERLYTIRCRNCKKIVHQTRDCRVTITPNTQGATVENQQGIVCYECGRPRHFRKDCPKLRNQHSGNQTRNKTGGNKVIAKAYAIGGGGTNLDSNVVTGTFLLNNYYASMLFDLGADRSIVSTTFSALLDVAPSNLDTSYAIELADGRVSETNIVLRGCTFGLLGLA
nr:hypothetical protein [Tanacetum cinerariifolium]